MRGTFTGSEIEVTFEISDDYRLGKAHFASELSVVGLSILGVEVDFDSLPADLQSRILMLADSTDFTP